MISESSVIYPGNMDWFILGLNPEAWAVGPLSVGRKNGRPYPIMGQNRQLAEYQAAVRSEIKRKYPGATVIDAIEYELVFVFHQVLEQYQTASGRTQRDKAADLTNLVKATEDAIQGVLIDNDKKVAKQTNYVSRSSMASTIPYVVIGVAPYLGFDPGELPFHVWTGVDLVVEETRMISSPIIVELPEQDVF